jgi:hypothetical protein
MLVWRLTTTRLLAFAGIALLEESVPEMSRVGALLVLPAEGLEGANSSTGFNVAIFLYLLVRKKFWRIRNADLLYPLEQWFDVDKSRACTDKGFNREQFWR